MALYKPLLKEQELAISTTTYVPLLINQSRAGTQGLGAHIEWDTGANFTATVEMSDKPSELAAEDSTDAKDWVEVATVTGTPTGGAAGATVIEIENARHRRARLKIATTAASTVAVWSGS